MMLALRPATDVIIRKTHPDLGRGRGPGAADQPPALNTNVLTSEPLAD
jgi:hypothetical protein